MRRRNRPSARGPALSALLDEGQYLCSERTMYRLLAAHHEVRERRNRLRHPRAAAPELLARRPNELWSWRPERFPHGLPRPPACPTEVWINPPATGSTEIAPDGSQGRSYAETHDLEPERKA